jgi:CheY-like chemotaxis protein
MSLRVVMVDDEESLVWSVHQYFLRQRPSWTFEGFTDPIACLARLRSEPPDVLITDVRMPSMSGLELMVAARAAVPGLPIIVVTAYGGEDVQAAVRARLAVEHMEKPIQFDRLFQSIERTASRSAGFSGDISLPMLPDLLQIYTLSLASGALSVRQSERQGTIWFERGEIVHAECERLVADDAVYELLRWTGGSFYLDATGVAPRRTISKSWQHLLMEGCRLLDEAKWATAGAGAGQEGPREVEGSDRDALLDRLRVELPGFLAAARVDAQTGRVLATAGRAPLVEGGGRGIGSAATGEVAALLRVGVAARIEDVLCTLDDQLHFLQRGRPGEFVFVATERGPAANPASIRNAISQRLVTREDGRPDAS